MPQSSDCHHEQPLSSFSAFCSPRLCARRASNQLTFQLCLPIEKWEVDNSRASQEIANRLNAAQQPKRTRKGVTDHLAGSLSPSGFGSSRSPPQHNFCSHGEQMLYTISVCRPLRWQIFKAPFWNRTEDPYPASNRTTYNHKAQSNPTHMGSCSNRKCPNTPEQHEKCSRSIQIFFLSFQKSCQDENQVFSPKPRTTCSSHS